MWFQITLPAETGGLEGLRTEELKFLRCSRLGTVRNADTLAALEVEKVFNRSLSLRNRPEDHIMGISPGRILRNM